MKYHICAFVLLWSAGCESKDGQLQSFCVKSNEKSRQTSTQSDTLRSAAKSSDPELLKRTLKNVNETLDMVYAQHLPDDMPNWIALHAALMYGAKSYGHRGADANVRLVFLPILNSNTEQNGPFVMRAERPWPRHRGGRFWQEHHRDQFLHILGMAGVPLDAQLIVDGRKFQVRDLLDQSLLEARPDGELAFTVSAYAHYLDVGQRWTNKFGESMSLAIFVGKLMKYFEPTCGGEHRLGGLARVLSRPELRNDPDLAALWPEVERQINSHIVLLQERQWPDGSLVFPDEMARLLPADKMPNPDYFDVFCTGHTLEWLTFVLSPNQLRDEWVVRATDRLASAVRSSLKRTIRAIPVGSDEDHYRFGQFTHAISGLRRWKDVAGRN